MSTFKRMASQITTSAAVIPATFAVMALIIVGGYAMASDYETTRLGIERFGLRTALPDEIRYLAVIPQAIQIVIIYVLGTRDLPIKTVRMNFTIYFIALVFDNATDVYFKASGMPFEYWILAFIVTIVFYTIGSEILFITGISIFIEIFPLFLEKLFEFGCRVWDIVTRAFKFFFDEDEEDDLQSKKDNISSIRR